MGGLSCKESGSSLVEVARKVEMTMAEWERKGLYLESGIEIIDRQHLQWKIEAMEKESPEKLIPGSLKNLKGLLEDPNAEWFASFHLHS